MRESPVRVSTTSRKMPKRTPERTPKPASGASLGQREKNKIDKLHRIKEAARELFLSKGFDDATTRAIASRAGVGIGTVFIYADNKRDLLFLVANDELAETTDKAEAGISDDASCLQNLLTVFRHHYEFFGRQPELSRLMLREMTFRLVASVMKRALERGAIRAGEDSAFVGWVAFCIYHVELRRWLTTKEPDIAEGMAALQRALKLYMHGLAPAKESLAVAERAPPRGRRDAGAPTSARS
jgi:AcrR family transcriptional regulator